MKFPRRKNIKFVNIPIFGKKNRKIWKIEKLLENNVENLEKNSPIRMTHCFVFLFILLQLVLSRVCHDAGMSTGRNECNFPQGDGVCVGVLGILEAGRIVRCEMRRDQTTAENV